MPPPYYNTVNVNARALVARGTKMGEETMRRTGTVSILILVISCGGGPAVVVDTPKAKQPPPDQPTVLTLAASGSGGYLPSVLEKSGNLNVCVNGVGAGARLLGVNDVVLKIRIGCGQQLATNVRACLRPYLDAQVDCGVTDANGEVSLSLANMQRPRIQWENTMFRVEIDNHDNLVLSDGHLSGDGVRDGVIIEPIANAVQASPNSKIGKENIEADRLAGVDLVKRQRAFDAAKKRAFCRIEVVGQVPRCDYPTKEDCLELAAETPEPYKPTCDRITATRNRIAERREARKHEPCSIDNSREELLEVDLKSANDERAVRNAVERCIGERVALCAPILGKGDIDATIGCYSQWPWTQSFDHAPRLDLDETARCLKTVESKVNMFFICGQFDQTKEHELVAKDDCFAKLSSQIERDTCGPFAVAPYLSARGYTDAQVQTEKVRWKPLAAPIRTRLQLPLNICTTFKTEATMQGLIDQERANGKVSGFVDAKKLHELGSVVVLVRRQRAKLVKEFRTVWKREFSRTADCK